VLAPTRELAIQVAEAFQKYATHLPGFHVLPIYGGQSYGPQLQRAARGVHVVVGTPGRVIDHLERGTLDLSTRCARWCWTKPTRCCAWASSTTSRRS
jgi:ATP-dependent RNA helicase DeaD